MRDVSNQVFRAALVSIATKLQYLRNNIDDPDLIQTLPDTHKFTPKEAAVADGYVLSSVTLNIDKLAKHDSDLQDVLTHALTQKERYGSVSKETQTKIHDLILLNDNEIVQPFVRQAEKQETLCSTAEVYFQLPPEQQKIILKEILAKYPEEKDAAPAGPLPYCANQKNKLISQR